MVDALMAVVPGAGVVRADTLRVAYCLLQAALIDVAERQDRAANNQMKNGLHRYLSHGWNRSKRSSTNYYVSKK
jgi:hypothetical protein